MPFEYNGHLLEDERINQVAKEIVVKYPEISFEKAEEAAMLEGRISSKKTIVDELNRLYNIMLINSDNKDKVLIIYKDYLNIIRNNYNNEDIHKYFNIIDGINRYFQGIDNFPFISN